MAVDDPATAHHSKMKPYLDLIKQVAMSQPETPPPLG
jgi:hypothetical protein